MTRFDRGGSPFGTGRFDRNEPGLLWRTLRAAATGKLPKVRYINPYSLKAGDGFPYRPPNGLLGVPLPEWNRPADGVLGCSFQINQMRWVKVGLHAQNNETYQIPLIDGNDVPFVDPAVPPMMVLKCWEASANTDLVKSSSWLATEPLDQRWSNVRPSELLSDENYSNAHLELATDPVPHWVLTMTIGGDGDARSTASPCVGAYLEVDILTNAGLEAPAEVEVGSDDVYGHYKIASVWTGQGFLAASDRLAFNERAMLSGLYGISNLTHPATSTITLADASAVNFFDLNVSPAWRQFIHNGLDVSFGYSNANHYQPSSWAQGLHRASSAPNPPLYPGCVETGYWGLMAKVAGYWSTQLLWQNTKTVGTWSNAAFYYFTFAKRNPGHGAPATPGANPYIYLLWEEQAAGTAAFGSVSETPAKYVAWQELAAHVTRVHLTADGAINSGASLFPISRPPWAEVMIAGEDNERSFSPCTRIGSVWWDGSTTATNDTDPYYYRIVRSDHTTVQSAAIRAASPVHWLVEVFPRGLLASSLAGNLGAVADPNLARKMVVHALGRAP